MRRLGELGRRYGLHLGLFVATCVSCVVSGGPVFAATLMTILVSHEMGHYVVARRHGVEVSLPYFIPLPYVSMGTLGAVIRMKASIERRDALIDVGAAGPLAGLAVAIPLLVWGLYRSPVGPLPPPSAGSFQEGNSLLYIGLKALVHGRYLPAGGVDVQLDDMAMAAWVGVLLTFINLMPVGQLDGGHVATAFFGDRHESRARWIHRALVVVGLVVLAILTGVAREAGRASGAALAYGAQAAAPWGVWSLMLLAMKRMTGGRYHPPVEATGLSPGRRRLFWLMVVVFILVFTPVPMREAL
jgi:membrane-associated protease RseP (regulator of RpoE activity)